MRDKKPQRVKVLYRKLWQQSGVVYARTYQNKVVYIGVTDGVLSKRINRHLRGIPRSMAGTAPRYRKRAEGKQITILSYKPPPVKLLGLKMQMHRAIEAALIKKFGRPGKEDWFVART